MSAELKRHILTIDDYHLMAEVGILTPRDRVELIRGEIITMSPIGTKHAAFVNQVSGELIRAVSRKEIVSIQNPLQISDHSEPEPDLLILRYQEDKYQTKHPRPADVLLLIEISDSTLDYDRKVKLPLYAEAGIPVVWIFNVQSREIEVYENPNFDRYGQKMVFSESDTLSFAPLNLTFVVKDLLP